MISTHNLGFPRIGKKRELKFALERFWREEISADDLNHTANNLKRDHWVDQSALNLAAVGDFSLYDQVLDMSVTLGNIPARFTDTNELTEYFRAARGSAPGDDACQCLQAGEMTKWFDTNYHYIVPEFSQDTEFKLDSRRLIADIQHAQQNNIRAKAVIIGPLSYLWLGKSKDNTNKLDLLEKLIPVYSQLLDELAESGISWVQIDEPILVTELDANWRHGFQTAYHSLQTQRINILLATYFGELKENLQLVCELPVQGVHLDAVRAREEVERLVDWLPAHKVLSLGVVDGRNIWKTDLNATFEWLQPIAQKLKSRLWLAPSCSLLHVPVDLNSETQLDTEIASWLAFAKQKIDEIAILAKGLNEGRNAIEQALLDNQKAITSRQQSNRVHNPEVKTRLQAVTEKDSQRNQPFAKRWELQQAKLKLPLLPTTTIGSFPQTADIRQLRLQFKQGAIAQADYEQQIQAHIRHDIEQQLEIDLDVLVHGEAERNDMVEYFGQQLSGFSFTDFGWVQSYGSRCVKPPIIFGDIARPNAMTVKWIEYAQSLTSKPVKGMLTGPVTILNWSFVRDDQPRSQTCEQIALAIRDEVLDLEKAGTQIIQIDEAALREGLPLRQSDWKAYLDWSINAFRLTANGVADETQIHTHMCYSEFNDIIEAIAEMDADVITIETSRSQMELLDAFEHFAYPNGIGPGVYDIHSPNIPEQATISQLLEAAAHKIPLSQLWVNPDCGLKTRQWQEVTPALKNMVSAAKTLRETLRTEQSA